MSFIKIPIFPALQKERDLELAATLGKSLLEQNRELVEKLVILFISRFFKFLYDFLDLKAIKAKKNFRNEFLEESLHASNEAIGQLRNQLRQRSSLFRVIADLTPDDGNFAEDDDDAGGLGLATTGVLRFFPIF
jgi:hypothetical protein